MVRGPTKGLAIIWTTALEANMTPTSTFSLDSSLCRFSLARYFLCPVQLECHHDLGALCNFFGTKMDQTSTIHDQMFNTVRPCASAAPPPRSSWSASAPPRRPLRSRRRRCRPSTGLGWWSRKCPKGRTCHLQGGQDTKRVSNKMETIKRTCGGSNWSQ